VAEFAPDLYRGSAGYRDRYRLPYPEAMITDLAPDTQVLAEAGFEVAGRREYAAAHRWTMPQIAGYVRSTSILRATPLGGQAAAFDADLAARLGPLSQDGTFTQLVSSAYDLARKPAADEGGAAHGR
jgi:hypothetical protein